jgi:hypothetical protein
MKTKSDVLGGKRTDAGAAWPQAVLNKAVIERGSAQRFDILVAKGSEPPVGSAELQAHLTI